MFRPLDEIEKPHIIIIKKDAGILYVDNFLKLYFLKLIWDLIQDDEIFGGHGGRNLSAGRHSFVPPDGTINSSELRAMTLLTHD